MGRTNFILGTLLLMLLLTGCGGGTKSIFSSRTSPDGSRTAQNILLDDAKGGTGHLIIRDNRSNDIYDFQLNEPSADLFMRWLDSSNLEIWSEGGLSIRDVPDMFGNIHIVRRDYAFPSSSADTYTRPGLPIQSVTVPTNNVYGTFRQYSDKVRYSNSAQFCVLAIATKPDSSYDTAKVEITVGMNIDRRPRPSAGVDTEFTLSAQPEPDRQTMLTSATISDIPSYNRLPTGDQGTAVRGQFLEQSAVALIEKLKQPTIQIEYSREFFQQVVKYDVPLAGAAEAIGQFNTCLGDADFLWLEHDHPR